jgi:hypothetical protein
MLKQAGLTWESYCEEFATESLPIQHILPMGFVFQLLQNLTVERRNQGF